MSELLRLANRERYRVYFLGATGEVLSSLLARVGREFPDIVVAGSRDGYFRTEESAQVAERISVAAPDILFVGMPTPRKEIFIRDFSKTMQVPFSMGVGGSFDVLAGKTKRAPRWMQASGLEWLFRLMQEPKRMFGRYAKTNIAFIILFLRERIR